MNTYDIDPDEIAATYYSAGVVMPNDVGITVRVTIPARLELRDEAEILEHIQMCVTRLRAAVLHLSSEQAPF